MYTLKVTRFRDGNTATEQGTTVQMLMDHLRSASERNGFELIEWAGFFVNGEWIGESGDLTKNGNVVGEYEISKASSS